MLCIVFGLSLLDRSNVPGAYIAGLAQELDLNVGARYNIVLLIFFVQAYALFELPSNMLIRRLGARYWLSLLICAWGCAVLVLPGAVYIIGSWYRQYETAKRISMFYTGSLLALAFGPIIAYLLSLIRVGDGKYRSGWRWIFIIEGAITIVTGLVSPLFLIECNFLTDRQKHIAASRVGLEKEGAHTEHATIRDSLKMLRDWKLGVYSMQYFIAGSSVYSISLFMPIILREGMGMWSFYFAIFYSSHNYLGFSYARAQLLCSPPYLFTCITSLLFAFLSDKIKLRWPILISQSIIGAAGLLIVLYARIPGVRYFGLFFATFGTQANIPSTLVYGQNQTAKVQKKAVVSAAMITAGAAGGICGALIFRTQDAPVSMLLFHSKTSAYG
ncbi:hypothetical protein N0V90_003498 [Kalmusia sp. IMI 367209]|nr:hypothetical protein N0V90_003498 [Kalmusia sp. IMI 367209]